MKKIYYARAAVVLVPVLVASDSLPITIRVTDGRSSRAGDGFKDQNFNILSGAGSRAASGRSSIYVEDIESIEFDSATTAAAASLANEETTRHYGPVSQPPSIKPAA